jgi:hypothetical protein
MSDHKNIEAVSTCSKGLCVEGLLQKQHKWVHTKGRMPMLSIGFE